MGSLSLTLPTVGQPNSTEDVKIVNAFTAIQTLLNGNVDGVNIADGGVSANQLASALAVILGVTSSGVTRRGKSSISTTETLTNPAFGLMTTPDRVSSVVLPTDGLIFVVYQATTNSPSSDAEATIYLGSNQVKANAAWNGGTGPLAMSASINSASIDRSLVTHPGGLVQPNNSAFTEPTTGLLVGAASIGGNPSGMSTTYGGNVFGWSNATAMVGGPAMIWAAAGTYDVSIRFKATSGVTVKNRHLWVWSMGF